MFPLATADKFTDKKGFSIKGKWRVFLIMLLLPSDQERLVPLWRGIKGEEFFG